MPRALLTLAAFTLGLAACSLVPTATPHLMHQHHGFDYVELTVADMAVAKAFYSSAFGWEFTDYGPNYAGIRIAEREVGGLAVGERPRGGPLVVLFSRDLPASEQSVRSAGGIISTPPFDFPGGRRFQFLDPSGNELAIWAEP